MTDAEWAVLGKHNLAYAAPFPLSVLPEEEEDDIVACCCAICRATSGATSRGISRDWWERGLRAWVEANIAG
ncbi:hypothetical protein PMIN01_12302 [Paraphaeosphaeria minitans]|uniref:Uncharacterized protein n=1 Tax=Paraphaeosphaeria minitans TaxID=565426 RepID=A0A9P6G669_9PLEO|nr:hypothetical protein PMIN01_12302 [Paraphaeosphaeria minitans]